ncbi:MULTISPECIES: cytochrome bd-I oxidase subunit CydX [Pseudomonas]|uniref:Cytochrome bd-I oxidase subunit CydX n=2 Tax=Pseudomonas kuykendallii TaxID=1007099 RepID=A0A2W5CQ21_9PSED|nr:MULTISPECIES: cytochrome bd-I oxidase subunit CydX [Pseudomonas]PZP21785.1 MAG: cytochrome bd-I oxidase subunit CydX [Pseudomonas kuykendallii]
MWYFAWILGLGLALLLSVLANLYGDAREARAVVREGDD